MLYPELDTSHVEYCPHKQAQTIITSYIRNITVSDGCEVLTPEIMKSAIFWDITRCSPLKVNGRFERAVCLQLQGRRMSQARNQPEAGN
jgi:hypothetical protein